MKCIDVKEHLENLLDNETGVILRDEIELHLDTCDECCAEFTELRSVSGLLRKELPIIAPSHLDTKVFAAFRQHQVKKSGWNLSSVISLLMPKPIFALLTLCALTGLAFLIGRMSVPKQEIVVSTPPQIIEKEVPKEVIKYVEAPTVKYVKIPIEKERIVTRTVYRNIKTPRNFESTVARSTNVSNQNSESAQQLDLKDFQPLGEISPRIVKKGEMDEK